MSAEIAIEVHRETRYWNLNLLEVAFKFVHNPDGIKKVFNLRNIRPQIHLFLSYHELFLASSLR